VFPMIKKLSVIEKELQKYNLIKEEANSLSTIYSNITGRIEILNSLRAEVEEISKNLYYYDLVDHLGNITVDSLNLQQTVSICKDLENAKSKFTEDNDTDYLKTCDKLRDKILSTGTKLCSNIIIKGIDILNKKGEMNNKEGAQDNLKTAFKDFYQLCPLSCKIKLENIYFKNRNIRSKIEETILDFRKNYSLLILGEMKSFYDLFPAEQIKHFPSNIREMSDFELYLYNILKMIFKRLDSRIVKDVLSKKMETPIFAILHGSAAAYYNLDISENIVPTDL
jgi:hypothetical protein